MERIRSADASLTGSRLVGDDLTSRLERWAADARVDDAARQRGRERWLRQQAEEGATFAGVLIDLAERAAPVTVQVVSGRRHQGTLHGVGVDFLVLGSAQGSRLVRLDAVVSVRTLPGEAHSVGERAVASGVHLVDVLIGMAAERERALLVPLQGGDGVSGTVVAVGDDVAVLRSIGERPGTVYVPLAALGEVVLEP